MTEPLTEEERRELRAALDGTHDVDWVVIRLLDLLEQAERENEEAGLYMIAETEANKRADKAEARARGLADEMRAWADDRTEYSGHVWNCQAAKENYGECCIDQWLAASQPEGEPTP